MEFFKNKGDITEIKDSGEYNISKETADKFDKLMEKDIEDNFEDNFDVEMEQDVEEIKDIKINEDSYETDDNGENYKKNQEMIPNNEYTINGNTYKTDERGNKISCDVSPKYTPDGIRNTKEQVETGGAERREDDDGGHIVARILGGSEGEENLVPMRRTLNRGDYKRMENEVAKALQNGEEVGMHINLEYGDDLKRPSKIQSEYTIDNRKTMCEFDNEKSSVELMDSLESKISETDYNRLRGSIQEMREDGCDVSITSVKVRYDESENPQKITVGILDESSGIKSYKEYEPK